MIELKNLSKSYGSTQAVSDLSFEVRSKEVFGFLGPNGAGKSTTLRILAGYLAPTSGCAKLGGRDIAEDGLEARRRIGYLPENNPLYDEMETAEYLEWCAMVRNLRGARRTARVRYAVEACDLGEVLGRRIEFLSKGFRQRVGLAAAILHDPDILLLDEPTSGLDPNQAREVRGLIARLKLEKTVVLSTHILSEVEASCDRILILNRGRIAAQGTPKELLGEAGRSESLSLIVKAGAERAGEIEEALGLLPGTPAARARKRGELWAVSLEAGEESPDLREPVFRLAVQRGWVLLEMKREGASLESLFERLTQR